MVTAVVFSTIVIFAFQLRKFCPDYQDGRGLHLEFPFQSCLATPIRTWCQVMSGHPKGCLNNFSFYLQPLAQARAEAGSDELSPAFFV